MVASIRESVARLRAGAPFIEPAQCLLLAMISMVALHVAMPVARVVPRDCFWGCIALAVLGIVLGELALRQMRRADCAFDPDAQPSVLLTSGCFAHTRNPMYLGMLLLLAGEAMMLGSVGALLPLPVFVAGLHFHFVRAEERRLEQAFGRDWIDYRRRVRRWI